MYKIIFLLFFVNILLCKELITPIPLKYQYNKEKAILGKKLFFDSVLSNDSTKSCASCHSVTLKKSRNKNNINILNTIFNNTFQIHKDSKNQNCPILLEENNKKEILKSEHIDFNKVVSNLKKNTFYIVKFSKLYNNEISRKTIINAINEFRKTLITPNAKFDKYLRGDFAALSSDEKEGYRLFKDYGCISCHNGINIGGNLTQKYGIVNDFNAKNLEEIDLTNEKNNKSYFKVPSLRNIELMAPYFHTRKIKSLKESLDKMFLDQVGYIPEKEEIDLILQFLHTLTGEEPISLEVDK